MTLSLYVHFPWCVRKCPYCDFNSHPLRGALQTADYLAALEADAREALAEVPHAGIATVFFGGGTPSLFPPGAFAQLLDALAPWLAADAEVTMEANPGTTEHSDFRGYRLAGINRLSLGAQSFEAAQLERLGRIHAAADTRRAFEQARRGGFDNINLDLMYALPDQSLAAALEDLREALSLGPEHISWYQLTIEPKTEFARRPPSLPDDELAAEMDSAGRRLLAEAGFERYEISAYAQTRPDRDLRCRHNLNYWRFGNYIGVGAGAHGKLSRAIATGLQVVRTAKAAQPRLYLAAPLNTETRQVAADELPVEFLMNALRLTQGVAFEAFESGTGLPRSVLQPVWDELADLGLVCRTRLAATELGLRYLDGVLARFLT